MASSSVTVKVTITIYFPSFSELTITISFAFNLAITIAVSSPPVLGRGKGSTRNMRSWDLIVARALLDILIIRRVLVVIWYS
jgi:hypothetical protein